MSKLIYRNIDSIDSDNYQLKKALITNPNARSMDEVGQLLGEVDEKGTIGGSILLFPIKVMANTHEYTATAGSTLSVDKKYRKSELGLTLPNCLTDISPSKFAIAAGISKIALPIYIYLGYHIFKINRYILPLKSKAILDGKIHRTLLPIAIAVGDFCLAIWRQLLRLLHYFAFQKMEIKQLTEVPIEINEISLKDNYRFAEIHNHEWFQWVLDNNFSKDARSKQSFYTIEKDSKIIGFFMTKTRFHGQASNRGFKNVYLGSVIEWGSSSTIKLPKWKLSLASLLSFGQSVDAIEFCTNDSEITSFLSKIGLRQIGQTNFAIKAEEESPLYPIEGLNDTNSWRIRPAFGDVGLS